MFAIILEVERGTVMANRRPPPQKINRGFHYGTFAEMIVSRSFSIIRKNGFFFFYGLIAMRGLAARQ